ncbi:hypothetical protein Aduo_008390 [Ancylostoma duodenale]
MSLQFAKSRVTKTKTSVENIIDSTKALLEPLQTPETGEEATKEPRKKTHLQATEKLEAAFKELDEDAQRKEEDSLNDYDGGATDEIIRIEELVGDLAEMEIQVLGIVANTTNPGETNRGTKRTITPTAEKE